VLKKRPFRRAPFERRAEKMGEPEKTARCRIVGIARTG